MSLTLCVLLWPHEGQAEALVAYEDRVLELLADHEATLLSRARSDGSDGHPLEVQLLQFPSQVELDGYLNDERRTALAAEREAAIARTDLMRVELV
jgi:hypothetical protein